MLLRRDLLKWAASGLGAGLSPAIAADGSVPQVSAEAQGAAPQGSPAPTPAFDFASVVERARTLAQKPQDAAVPPLPGAFANLTYEQYVSIRSKPGNAVWADDNVGFAIEPLHRGFLFTAPVTINVVENGVARRLVYAANQFDFGKLQVPADIGDIGFSGFRVLHARSGKGLVDSAIFQGASFFRALANGQNFGQSARALMIRTADPRGEEFPAIREVWIEKPSLASDVLVISALVTSDSMTGAYRFTLRPGDVTIIDTECTLFSRSPADFYGLGGMTAMFLFGPTSRHGGEDVRLGAYDVSGLQILNGNGEWLWRPVCNPSTLQVSVFVDANPRGFGLLQRQRNFDDLQDDEQHWELRPSLWIEPINDWGEGSVELVEIPTDTENNDNILCFWRPKAVLDPNAEASFSYRQFWCWTPPDRPPLAVVSDTRIGRIGSTKRRRFVVEFQSDLFTDPTRVPDLKPMLTTSVGALGSLKTFLSRERKSCRIVFEIDFGGEPLSEMRLVLQSAGKPISETWLYRWTA
jgi:periplasmic glucans biosynthesis protein